ncbi:PilX N-terminal domain-containing pilus assembly protein [uncultured Shewanella sp.]|uniref:pilus assembly PilX family protein n=1 Tax=uncultured Shewanella sp. TaxID=173975 RepID=UPI0026253448|nr:PilX N-terminal domain-containing pilus assembly protein [uncultured Shewanella sp.]
MRNQQGMVLFFSLIVLLIMTVIGVAVAMNATQSLRMSQAGSDRVKANIALQGALNTVVMNNEGSTLANLDDPQVIIDAAYNVTSTLTPLYDGDVACARSSRPTAGIECRKIELSSEITFGRGNLAQLTRVSGLEQEVLAD